MHQQQDTGIKPPDDGLNSKSSKHRTNEGSSETEGGGGGGADTHAETQQPQRCPRCDSLNTKFCYYNNYSLTQPRHFCKNCRRYWTKGGTLRNVPVGGGCRKNKRLKQRDSSCLTALQPDVDAGLPPHNMQLPSIDNCGISGFSPNSPSSFLLQDFANDGHRQLALSGYSSVPLLEPHINFLVHPRQACHDQLTLFDRMSPTASPAAQTLEPLSSFSSASMSAPGMYPVCVGPAGICNPTPMEPPLSLIPLNLAQMNDRYLTRPPMHSIVDDLQLRKPTYEDRLLAGGHTGDNRAEISMTTGRAKPLMASQSSEWTSEQTEAAHQETGIFNMVPQSGEMNLWNASWPEMHAALAGSTTPAGALLH
ncbi:hypothetical protein KP509_19G013700 [Ceratopteris richardii]|uniref:Dof-type domain-containing protein n=1 Tax=Ceratopteris richardii TaxID=49495 RepID=A0A8T2SK67_CERRI|nr:hypothetical protein KP509_19G013700 [Ceratopteris richardii]KAH7351778.1 hypothetical protein KP509_19G013700 [Ceratopteris richardii]